MDKNAIKKYAIWARRELIARVSQKAYQYGIRGNDIIDANADSVDGKILGDSEKRERQALITQVKEKGFEQVMEEVAYTWFNRFSALRFMEVNGYLPTHVRVFTDDENNFKPQIIAEAIHVELDGLDMEKVYALKEADNNDELFKYLLITQCNALNEILPGMFQQIADYTELLFPDNLLREGSVIEQMIALIPEDDWKDAVQIIGWLYQYYNSEPKDIVFANMKKKIKLTKENIPAATQLFTPDWIVRYMVENSLGRLWLEGHPDDELKAKWNYYLEEAEQKTNVQEKLDKIHEEYQTLKPEEIRVIDPCMGSGHILVYTFDVLMQIYEEYGFNQRDAAKSIVENNIFGLDIDERATQLAYFAVMMKARQYDRRFFSRKVQPHVYAICESNHLDPFVVEYFVSGNYKLKADIQTLIDDMHDAKEYGSILDVTNVDFDTLYDRFNEIKEDISIYGEAALNDLLPFVQVAQVMSQKYHIVVTNPPYMTPTPAQKNFVEINYPNSKADLYAVFIEKCRKLTIRKCYYAMITQHSWMFLSSFKDFRRNMGKSEIVGMAHLGKRAFEEIAGEIVQTTSFVCCNIELNGYQGTYFKLDDYNNQNEKEAAYLEKKDRYIFENSKFKDLPDGIYSYWATEGVIKAFKTAGSLGKIAAPKRGMCTCGNDLFYRNWHEISYPEFCYPSDADIHDGWVPLNKGGEFRKWYGNLFEVVDWKNNAERLRRYPTAQIKNENFYFLPAITWSSIASKRLSFRYTSSGFIFDQASNGVFPSKDSYYYFLGLLNSKAAASVLTIINPSLNVLVGDISKIPIVIAEEYLGLVNDLVKQSISISKNEWDSFEISWDFRHHPILDAHSIKAAFENWQTACNDRFNQIKANEEELNRIFIDSYGLQAELTPEVDDKDITIRKADLQREIKGLISYAVGCMFGRYSLDVNGLAYAGGEWDVSKYRRYPADADNIIPICDDEYFSDDIMGRFVKFVETVYGAGTLEENLKFIADALGGKGSSREVIRNYFMNDFYNDHCKMYQKLPIYWLFDSGKKNGFKALIYMHRYQPDTIARMRTDYVHEQQERYRTAITHLEERINNSPTSERVKLNKQLGKLKDQATEIRVYEEEIHHLADQMIHIELDDGVKKNYAIFKDVLAKIK